MVATPPGRGTPLENPALSERDGGGLNWCKGTQWLSRLEFPLASTMAQTPRTSPRSRRPAQWLGCAALAVALLGSSCKSNERWAFSVTREVYGGGKSHDYNFNPRANCSGGGEAAAIVLIGLILLPIAIDLVVLPITLTHDLCDLD